MNQELKKTALSNLLYSFFAQGISMCLSIMMSLLIPKMLGIEDFGYWQLFLFYINYVGFFHFGITDGMYLKTGGVKYEDLDKKNISTQFYTLLAIQVVILISILILLNIYPMDGIRKIILVSTGVYMIIANLNWYLGYVFQATNLVKVYSASVIIDKILFLIFIIIALVFKINNILIYIPVFILTTTCALVFSILKSKDIIFIKPYPIIKSLRITLESAKIGIKLTISSISSLLILGVGRFIVDKAWGIESFSKFSLALSLTNFFLLFISQVSIVLFPALRRVGAEVSKKIYNKFNLYLDALLPIIYVLYIPIKIILGKWLPQYSQSLSYLAILLPICIFDGKTQMLNNTYFKVLRKENTLLKINLFSMTISIILSLISVFVLKDINLVIIGILIAVCMRSILGEIILSKEMKLPVNIKQLFYNIIFSALFIIYSLIFSNSIAFILTIISYIIYSVAIKSHSYILGYFNKVIKSKQGK